MKKKRRLSFILCFILLCVSARTVCAGSVIPENNAKITRAGDEMIDALETVTMGKAKYRLYTCTILLSSASEGKISFQITSYVNAAEAEKTNIRNMNKKLSLSDVTASFIGGSSKSSSGSKSMTGTSGDYSKQSGSGSGILYYGSSKGLFSCNDGNWTRNTSCTRTAG